MSNSDAERCFTPSYSTLPHEDHDGQSTKLLLSPPLADNIFIIRHPQNNLVITLQEGNLCLNTLNLSSSNCHWRLIETASGWLGLRNIQTDTYIRHNGSRYSGDWKFVADVKHHSSWESFSTRPASGGRHYEGGWRGGEGTHGC